MFSKSCHGQGVSSQQWKPQLRHSYWRLGDGTRTHFDQNVKFIHRLQPAGIVLQGPLGLSHRWVLQWCKVIGALNKTIKEFLCSGWSWDISLTFSAFRLELAPSEDLAASVLLDWKLVSLVHLFSGHQTWLKLYLWVSGISRCLDCGISEHPWSCTPILYNQCLFLCHLLVLLHWRSHLVFKAMTIGSVSVKPTRNTCLCVHIHACVLVHVAVHMCMQVGLSMHAKARGQPWASFLVALHFSFWNSFSHGTPSLWTRLNWLDSEIRGSVRLCLPPPPPHFLRAELQIQATISSFSHGARDLNTGPTLMQPAYAG